MSKSRNNHYVPQWYQEGFFEPDRNDFVYLDLTPRQRALSDGRVFTERSKFVSPTSRAFCQRDLYSTFFGTSVSDEIERKLFGDIDTRGANAVRAFLADDASQWHHHFRMFFEYLDVQKTRTPKGLDWLSAQYPRLTQNELMFEMQGTRMMHCTIWTEGVREIVSAQGADVKFIVSDHPVTVYNYAVPLDAKDNVYPNEPSIALKGSQTIFPLNRDFCLILTNLEYAQDHSTSPIEKRTFAGNYRNSMVRTDAFIRTRQLTSQEVVQFNRVLKARAKRYIAAGKEEWLYPEAASTEPWAELRGAFLPPKNDLWQFGGEMYVGFDSGEVRYQDAFGRTEKEREFLKKTLPAKPPDGRDQCGCGSGRKYSTCCEQKPFALRPTWAQRSIRERNLMLFNGITNILGLTEDRDWAAVRREITDHKIKAVYGLYDALWPRETNMLAMLPKPDGSPRAIYSGVLHPSVISNCALGLSLYFDELLIQHPFVHPRSMKQKFNPLEHPRAYRQEFLKSVVLFMAVMPFVERGLVTLFPDPCDFDFHLRDQMFAMAKFRAQGMKVDPKDEVGLLEVMKEEHQRSMLLLPRDALQRQIIRQSPELDENAINAVLDAFDALRERDPLAVLQAGSLEGGKDGGQFLPFKMAPNLEITMYLAQATGACIVTDSALRWRELTTVAGRSIPDPPLLTELRKNIEQSCFYHPVDIHEIIAISDSKALSGYPDFMRKVLKYLSGKKQKGSKPNFEASLNATFRRTHESTTQKVRKSQTRILEKRVSCLWPAGGIQDNSVNRLLLMSSSEHHLASVPMALYFRSSSHFSA